jgi:hypothetical protein
VSKVINSKETMEALEREGGREETGVGACGAVRASSKAIQFAVASGLGQTAGFM